MSFGLITTLHIVLGNWRPRASPSSAPEATALVVARPVQAFHAIFRWPIAALSSIGNAILRLPGLEPSSGHEMVHSVEELRLLVTRMEQAGVVEVSEAVPVTSRLPDLLARAANSVHSRWLVYDSSLDNIVGMLPVRGLFRHLGEPPEVFRLQTLLRPVLVAPASKPADDLLDELRSSRQQLAVLLDEYGSTASSPWRTCSRLSWDRSRRRAHSRRQPPSLQLPVVLKRTGHWSWIG